MVRGGAQEEWKRGPLGGSNISQIRIARITEYINEKGKMSAAELSASLSLDTGIMSRYLRHMRNSGSVDFVQLHGNNPVNPQPVLYGVGQLGEQIDSWAEMPPAVRKLTSWPGGAANPDPLVAALFSPANFRFHSITSANQIRAQ